MRFFERSEKYPWCLFSIDALSIDQNNAVERNHQVQQMGKIYSEATEVTAWLGDDPLYEEYLKSECLTSRPRQISEREKELEIHFTWNGYWTRAWIV